MNHKNKVYDSQFLELIYDPKTNILERHWKARSEKMDTDEFKSEMLELLEAVKKHKPTMLLGDTLNFHYIILPEVQEWSDDEVYSKFADFGIKKMAMVNSRDVYASMSVEQAITESPKAYEVNYFDNEDEAIHWLKR